MAVFDKIGSKFNQTTGILKINALITEETALVEAQCLKIGKLYCESHPDNLEQFHASVQELVKSVKTAEANIAGHNVEIKKLKGIVACTSCNADIQPGNMFCMSCGTQKQFVVQISNKGKTCANCGADNPMESNFCVSCGDNVQYALPTPAPQLACNSCGAARSEGSSDKFCVSCGTSFVTTTPDPTPEVVQQVAPVASQAQEETQAEPAPIQEEVAPFVPPAQETAPSSTCPSCNQSVGDDMLFCIHCGQKVK